MFEKYDLDYLQTQQEGLYFERKSARIRPRDIIKPIIAFANANGGIIALGLEDDGTLSGFSNSPNLPDTYIDEIRRVCLPPPVINTHKVPYGPDASDYILLLSVEPSINQVITDNGRHVYFRVKDSSRELSPLEVIQLQRDKGEQYFEDIEAPDSSIDDIDLQLLSDYKDKMSISHKPDFEVLKARGLTFKEGITYAGILLFGNNPTRFLPNARIKFIRYDGISAETGSRLNIIKEVTFDSAIPTLIPQITDLVKSQLRDFQLLHNDGRFTVIPEYPEFAWFEGIVNAVTHRDYGFRGDHIRIKMFDDRLEIFSPGKLPNIVTLSNMKTTRFSRNPKIARILGEFNWVREFNEGVNRIYEEMKNFFLDDPIYSEPNNNAVQLTLKNNFMARHLRASSQLQMLCSPDLWSSFSIAEKDILRLIYARQQITTKEAANFIEMSLVSTRSILKKLLELNLLEWHGTSPKDRNQYYTLNSTKFNP